MNMTPANDNTPRHAVSFADTTARREWLALRPEWSGRKVLNWPTIERLAKTDKLAAAALLRWRDLTAPYADVAANDNESMSEGFGRDRDLETRPTVDELQVAWEQAPVLRVSVTMDVASGVAVRDVHRHIVHDGVAAQLGPLRFLRGRLQEYARTARDKPIRPVERLRGPKGRRDLKEPETGGRVAGFSRSSGLARQPDRGEAAADAEVGRRSEERLARRELGEHCQILDTACTDATAREIGELRGFTGKTAERWGVRLVDAAITAFRLIENKMAAAA